MLETAPVEIDGQLLFRVRGVSSFPAEQRAEAIRKRIEKVAADPAFPSDRLSAEVVENVTMIMAGQATLMIVSDADAQLEHTSRDHLATLHLSRIREAIDEYRRSRTSDALLNAGLYGGGATVLLALGITIPNSQILNGDVTNFSSLAVTPGLILHTTVGIGYETPWRQVEAMLRIAAKRTTGIVGDPQPFILLTALGDFAVTYELNGYIHDPHAIAQIRTDLHRHILDVFNEYGVQIMTPAYEGDPSEPKVVRQEHWYEAPASSVLRAEAEKAEDGASPPALADEQSTFCRAR